MDPSVSASFIPKKPLADVRGSRGGAYGLVFIIALLIFITSIVAAAGAFLYVRILDASLEAKKVSLAKYQDAYDLATIETLFRFDSRINEARKLLKAHIAPSTIFDFLSQQTLQKVQLTTFDYSLGNDGSVALHFNGIADSFSTVALQSDQLGASKVLKDVVFSNIAVGNDGRVTFSVTTTMDPSYVLYSTMLTPIQDTSTTTSP